MSDSIIWHEAGHAIFASLFPEAIEVEKITLTPNEDRQAGVKIIKKNGNDFKKNVVVYLAGMIIENLSQKQSNSDKLSMLQGVFNYICERFSNNVEVLDSFDGDFKNIIEELTNSGIAEVNEIQKIIENNYNYFVEILIVNEISHEIWYIVSELVEYLKSESEIDKEKFNKFLEDEKFSKTIEKHNSIEKLINLIN